MKKFLLSIVAVAALVALPMGAKADTPDLEAATSKAHAKIVVPISISNTSSKILDFGTIASSSTSVGTVTVAPSSSRSVSNSHASVVTQDQTAAEFTIAAQSGATYTISLPTNPIVLSGSLTVTNFTRDLTAGSLTMNATGSQVFYVGATLNVPISAAAGDFQAPFTVNVNYN